jgi:hypothetical protein
MAAQSVLPVLAHVKWYVDDPHNPPIDLRLLTEPLTIALLVGAVAIAIVWRVVGTRLPRPELPFLAPLGRLAPWIPRILGIHLGVSLLALAVTNSYLAPHLSLEPVPGGSAIALLEGILGVWLITGVKLRPAAIGVILLGPLGLAFAGPVAVLEAVDTLGVAIFLALVPPGSDAFGARRISAADLHRPLLALRVCAGVALVVLAFSEKLLTPDLAGELLAEFPQIDVFSILGFTIAPETYVLIAAVTELLFGLLLISGAAPQAVVLIASVPFNLTLLVFDRYELIGHLPIYGILLALLVYGSSREHAHVVPQVQQPEDAGV